MKCLSKFLVSLSPLIFSTFSYAMEMEKNITLQTPPVEQAHWSTQEFQSPLALEITNEGAKGDDEIYSFWNDTSTDLFLSLHYTLKNTNDPDISFNTQLDFKQFISTFKYQAGFLTEEIKIKAGSTSSIKSLSTLSCWSEIEKEIEKITKKGKKTNYTRFEFTLQLQCSSKKLWDGIDFSCPNTPILTLSTDEHPLKYKYKNPFYSVFVIEKKPVWDSYLEKSLPFSITNHILCHSQ